MEDQNKDVLQLRSGESCETCVFFDPGWDEENERPYPPYMVSHGKCARFPPQFTGRAIRKKEFNGGQTGKDWDFPHVNILDWCGEYKKQKTHNQTHTGK